MGFYKCKDSGVRKTSFLGFIQSKNFFILREYHRQKDQNSDVDLDKVPAFSHNILKL